MPEEIEVPTDSLQDKLKEEADKRAGRGEEEPKGPSWILGAALTAALLAVTAAIAALLAGKHANEGMIDQMRAADSWAYYQSKGVKEQIVRTRIDLLVAMGKPAPEEDGRKVADYAREEKEIEAQAKEAEEASRAHMERHETFAKSVTFAQVAIALSAIAVLARRRAFWIGSVVLGIGALAMLFRALV